MSNFAVYSVMKHFKALVIGILATILLCGSKAQGQDYPWLANNNIMVEARVHYGFFYHHHFEMERFNKHYGAFEASVYQNTYGKNEWEPNYNYPYIGATFYYSNLGGFEELGNVFALYPFINYPLNRNEKSQLTFKLGVGLAYLTKHFDPYDNYYNFSIGSHINAAVNLSFEYRQRITSRLMSVASIGLTHFSNGSTKLPNYGLNTFSAAIGLAYYLRKPRLNLTPAVRPEYYPFEFDKKKWLSFDLNYGIGFKNVSQTLGGDSTYYYTVHDLSFYALGQFTRYSRAGFGVSCVLDLSDQTLPNHKVLGNGLIQAKVMNPETHENYIDTIRIYQMTKLNVSICYSMTMERLSYYFEFGWHLKYNRFTDLSKGNIFQKISLRYRVHNNIYAHISLMTHFGRADYLCFGVGYRFNQKYYLNHEKSTKRHPPGVRD